MKQILVPTLTILVVTALALGLTGSVSSAPAAWGGSPAGHASYLAVGTAGIAPWLAPTAAMPLVAQLPTSTDFGQAAPKCSTRSRSHSPKYCSATNTDPVCSAQGTVFECSALGRASGRGTWCSIRFDNAHQCSAAPNPAGQRSCSAVGNRSFCSTAVKHTPLGACSANDPNVNIRCSAYSPGALCSTMELNGSVTPCDRL